jgi:D-arabinose 1-dehydrogenase-like Zn-dependent alcohol dehydrogenase
MGYDVIAVDTGSDKQKLCASLGADHFIDFKTAVRPLQLLPPLRNRLHGY